LGEERVDEERVLKARSPLLHPSLSEELRKTLSLSSHFATPTKASSP